MCEKRFRVIVSCGLGENPCDDHYFVSHTRSLIRAMEQPSLFHGLIFAIVHSLDAG